MQDREHAVSEPRTQFGDVWLLGSHRLVCGDSTDAMTVRRCLDGATPKLMSADPPYGIAYDPNWRANAATMRGEGGQHRIDFVPIVADHRTDWRAAYVHFTGPVVYVWHAGMFGAMAQRHLEECGFEIRSQIIWDKVHFAISRGAYHWQHETCWYGVRRKATAGWVGDRKQSTVWSVPWNRRKETDHPNEKPVDLVRRPLLNHTAPGDTFYDPFCGSGTSLIAGEVEGRFVRAIEIDPVHCDTAVARWEKLTGQTARRE